jgi:hypothetical protein
LAKLGEIFSLTTPAYWLPRNAPPLLVAFASYVRGDTPKLAAVASEKDAGEIFSLACHRLFANSRPVVALASGYLASYISFRRFKCSARSNTVNSAAKMGSAFALPNTWRRYTYIAKTGQFPEITG